METKMKILTLSATNEEIGKLSNLEAIINFSLPVSGDILYARALNSIPNELMSKKIKYFNFALNAFERYVPAILIISYLIN
ncbi:MAG: hypothetical protein AABY22_31315 [Nanoarchaeota archaeon]